ncbi:NAD(P)/FAD-dependent oxidoreductase [Streptomyces sp. APSN-46.1]|uniref:NAD(P)/FAD-dependent oxidoreductase n=1 Tax=Streptomyces sp. APSN-46.1 TaxID=2929049 RepID=UPI0027E4ACD7|nr:NAD(P)/FAD-dependent oxidoreductase [Streptomyces sp. APSN-46.1]
MGGGPAGSSAAVSMARRGLSVLVLERSTFPRFHIGESMLTYTSAVLDKLGITPKVKAEGFPVKTGAEFCDGADGYHRVDFTDQGAGRALTTYQLERADFDTILLEHAAECGAKVVQNARVTKVETEGDRVVGVTYSAGGAEQTVRARVVIDASGRAGLITKGLLRSRKYPQTARTVAVFRHFTGVDEATNPGVEGDIQVGAHADGWLWAIPVRKDKLSVGAVTTASLLQGASSPDDLFAEHVNRIPRIRQRIKGAEYTETHVESEFTYYSDQVAGPGFFVVGDAGAFANPIFSAGVYLALVTGSRAGELTADILSGEREETATVDEYERFYKTGYDTYTRLIHGFYSHDYNLGRFLKSTGARVAPIWVARLLGGDFWSEKNPLGRHLRGLPDNNTFSAYEPMYGCPVYPELDAAEPADTQLSEGLAAALD